MLNYYFLTQQQYVDLVVALISSAEGHLAHAIQPDPYDPNVTIGYGYTFNRGNNLALWQAAGIALTAEEVADLQAIDTAPPAQRNNLALQFTRSISKDEAIALLQQTYPEYEGPAIELSMPLSSERAALVSLYYNRGGNLEEKIPGFYAAIRAQDRAEAWFQMRYNSWGTSAAHEAGLRARRLVEAQVFGLYDNVTNISSDEAKQVFRMWTRHEVQIRRDESLWGVNPDGTSGIRNMINEVNSDARWATLPRVRTIFEAFTPGADVLVSQFSQGISIDWQNIYIGEDSTWYRGTDSDLLTGSTNNDLIFGESGNDLLDGGRGQDVLYGGSGQDIYRVRPEDGNDTILDGDGKGLIVYGPDNAPQALTLGIRQPNGDGLYRSPDGSIVYQLNGTDLTITLPNQQVLTVRNFDQANRNLHLALLDKPETPTGNTLTGTENHNADVTDTGILQPSVPTRQQRRTRSSNAYNFSRVLFAVIGFLAFLFEPVFASDIVEPIELSTSSFQITVIDHCEAGDFFCKEVTLIRVNRKTGQKAELKGQAMVRFCADGKTPCEQTGYLFSDGQTMYEVTRDGWLIVSDGPTGKILIKEKGKRVRQSR